MTRQQQSEETTHVPGQARRSGVPSGRRAQTNRLPHRGICRADARRRARCCCARIWLSLDPYMRGRMSDGPSYATAGADRRRDGGRHRQRGRRPPTIRRFAKGDIVLSRARLADPRGLRRAGARQDRSGARAGLDRARRARHARHDRLYGPARHRPAAGRRDRGGCGGLRRGRLGGRPDRQDQGRARGRHRRRQGQVRLCDEGARLRRLHRSSRSRSRREAEGGLPEGHRRLFRECRRRGVRGGVSAAQRLRARARLRPDRALQRHRGRSAEMGGAR